MYKIFTLAAATVIMPFSIKISNPGVNMPCYTGKKILKLSFTNIELPASPFIGIIKKEEPYTQNWLDKAKANISKTEYFFNWEETIGQFSTPNRKNNLRFFYDNAGFSVEPRTIKATRNLPEHIQSPITKKQGSATNWKIRFSLDKKLVGAGRWVVSENKAQYITERMTIRYSNDEKGMKQDFVVNGPISANNILKINLSVNTKLRTRLINDRLEFFNKGINVLNYEQLNVFDGHGLRLPAQIKKKNKNNFAICVNTRNATWPVTIDPLSTTPDNIPDDADQSGANFGVSVSSAGDVNGDGYSDVIIGAYNYDDGINTNEGRAFVYHGSSTGLSPTPNSIPDDANQANAQFGFSVATAGDVNGDGYSDVIIGANLFDDAGNNDEGRAFLYYGSAVGISLIPNSVPDDCNQADAQFGISVACAGDVNGDGYSDVIIGAYLYDDVANTDEGRAFVYYGSAAGLSAAPNNTPDDANQPGAYFGISVSSAGDVNGDGYSDVIIGADNYNDAANIGEGGAFVYYGSAAGLSAAPNNTPDDANQALASFGNSVACAEDVNGDGYSDIIIGAYLYDDGANSDEGRAFIYYGSVTGVLASPSGTPDDADQAVAQFAYSVASAGDVNGDGYADIIIGSYAYDDGANFNEGRAFVYYGSASGISSSPDNTPDDANQASAFFGVSVASAGDVNGDGYSDVIIGAYAYTDGVNSSEGRAFVYNGSAAGINTTAATTMESNQAIAAMGFSVASAGDINADGYSDVIIGADGYDNGQTNEGIVFIYHGSATGINTIPTSTIESNQANALMGNAVASAGDVNADGYSDVIIGAYTYDNGQTDEGVAFIFHGSATGINIIPAATLECNQAFALFGASVASAGDVNSDGYSDVIVGSYSYDNGQANEGAAFIYHGSAGGINSTAAAMMESNQASAQLGYSVASAGDANGDGYSDVIIGANQYANGQAQEGAAFVYYGSVSGINTGSMTMEESNQVNARMGFSVASAGDVNGDGYSDVIVGVYLYDNGQSDEGAAFVYHGSATGIGTTVSTVLESNQASAWMGISVSSAGDVNGDGYSDVIVGVQQYDDVEADEGAAFIFHGSATGINTTVAAIVESNFSNASMGNAVSCAGDINGDGYSDEVVGAVNYSNVQAVEGAVYIFHGNSPGVGKRNNLRMYNTDLVTSVNSSNFNFANFGAGLYAKSFLGRAKGKMVWETRLNYNAYSGNPITNSAAYTSQQGSYTDLGLTGIELKTLIAKLLGSNKFTKLRARVKYDPVTAITGQVYGPWRNASSVIDANNLGVLPIELISFKASWLQKGKTAQLNFTTDKESGICCFDIEKSLDGFNFSPIGIVPAKNIAGVQTYNFIDNQAVDKKQFYRLKIKGISGLEQYSNIQQLQYNNATEILVFPNPAANVLQLQLNNNYDKINVQITNTLGQIVKQFDALIVTNQNITLPIASLPPGNYWLRLQAGAERQVIQFAKQ